MIPDLFSTPGPAAMNAGVHVHQNGFPTILGDFASHGPQLRVISQDSIP